MKIHNRCVEIIFQHEVVIIQHFAQLGGKALTVKEFLHTNRAPRDFILVGRPDAAPGGADFRRAFGDFTCLIQRHMVRQNQRTRFRNNQAAAYIDADTPREERDVIGRQLADGSVQVVVNIGTLTTGIDWDVRCLILARPTKSVALFVQIVGRALRTADGKASALILDHSDTHQRLGLITDVEEAQDGLDDGRRKPKDKNRDDEDKIPLPWECKSCAALVPATLTTCSECGEERRLPPGISTVAGELAEIGGRVSAGPKPKRDPVKTQLVAMGKTAVYAQLLGMCEERRRSVGWAAHAYRELFGVWPVGLPKHYAVWPGPLLRSWLKSRDIAWSKAQRAAERGHPHA